MERRLRVGPGGTERVGRICIRKKIENSPAYIKPPSTSSIHTHSPRLTVADLSSCCFTSDTSLTVVMLPQPHHDWRNSVSLPLVMAQLLGAWLILSHISCPPQPASIYFSYFLCSAGEDCRRKKWIFNTKERPSMLEYYQLEK